MIDRRCQFVRQVRFKPDQSRRQNVRRNGDDNPFCGNSAPCCGHRDMSRMPVNRRHRAIQCHRHLSAPTRNQTAKPLIHRHIKTKARFQKIHDRLFSYIRAIQPCHEMAIDRCIGRIPIHSRRHILITAGRFIPGNRRDAGIKSLKVGAKACQTGTPVSSLMEVGFFSLKPCAITQGKAMFFGNRHEGIEFGLVEIGATKIKPAAIGKLFGIGAATNTVRCLHNKKGNAS